MVADLSLVFKVSAIIFCQYQLNDVKVTDTGRHCQCCMPILLCQ